jgi:hypothetical protein
MKKHVVYCDESGNTGSNYLDPQQPIYVLAGWWVRSDSERKAEDIIIAHLGLASGTEKETKGSRLVRRLRGQRTILTLFRELGALGCVPVFVLAEKRYCVAAKIVETFLDPYYNSLLRQEFTADARTKQDLADILYELPEEVLRQFALAYRSLNSKGLSQSLLTICQSLSLRLHTSLADAMMGSISRIEDIVEAELASGDGVPGNAWRTLNMPVVVDFICTIEEIGRRVGVGESIVVHDETTEFQDSYDWLLKIFKNARKVDIYLPNGKLIPLGFETLKRFQIRNSAACPLIRAADALAGSLCAFAAQVSSDRPSSQGLVEIATLLLPATMVAPQMGTLIGSRKLIKKAFEAVAK